MKNTEMIFVGFNGKAAALDRGTGEILWQWTAPKGAGCIPAGRLRPSHSDIPFPSARAAIPAFSAMRSPN